MTAEVQSRNLQKVYPVARAEGHGQAVDRDEFLALLSHELRTPLQALVGWVRLLERDVAAEVRSRAIASIHRNVRAMGQIVDDIADLSRISSGKLRLTVSPVDLRTLVRNVVETVRPFAEERRVFVEARTPAVLPIVHADAGRLRQVLANLLSNALKFTPAEGRVIVEAEALADSVRISVRDTGCGIDMTLLPHVFARFYQGQDAVARGQGLGLGLPLVKELVERHGGTVRAQSEGPGRGAEFIVILPSTTAGPGSSAGEEQVHENPVCNGPAAEERVRP